MTAASRSFAASMSAMIGLCLVIMLIALDTTVVGTAMPRIVAELQGYDLYTWTASAYLLTNAVMIPIMGRIGDLFGRKPFVIASILLFTLASVLCGLAQSMLQLVLARGLQGIGGGMLTGVDFASVNDLFPDRLQRVRWQAMLSATFGIATALGPWLGGWLTEHAGWRTVFFVNIPVAVVAFPVIARFLPHMVHSEEEDKSIDWVGALLLAVSIVALLLATEQGQMHGLLQPMFIGLMVAALIAGALFIWHQHHSVAPIIPPRLFANRAVLRLSAIGVFTGLVMFVLLYYSPLLLQGGFDLSPKTAGLLITPLLVTITIGSIINGKLIAHLRRPERLLMYGQIMLFGGCLFLIQMHADSDQRFVMFAFSLCGMALGFQLPNLTLQIQAVVELRDVGIASALIQTTRMLGSMVGTSLAAVIVNTSYSSHVDSVLSLHGLSDNTLTQLLNTPQILVRAEDQAAFARLATKLNFAAEPMLHEIRTGLITGVHNVYLGCALAIGCAVLLSLQLPHYDPHRRDG